MRVLSSVFDEQTSHPFFLPISGLTGIFLFLRQVLDTSSIEHGMAVATAAGAGVYLILIAATVLVRRITSTPDESSGPQKKDATS